MRRSEQEKEKANPQAESQNLKTTPNAVKTETIQVVGVCVFLMLAVLAVFGQTAHFEFVNYDDQLNVFENSVVEKGLSVQAVVWAFTHTQVANWIPLTTLSHMLDCQIFGLRAGGHHMVNVLWHAANAVFLFLVLRQMTGSLWRSAFVAAIFAVHPLRAESVAWVTERKDVLSGFFFILTIGAYVRYTRKPSLAGYVVICLLFALGLMAKSMVATLPFVLLLLDYWPLGRMHNWKQCLRLAAEKTPLFALSAGACVVTALVPGLLVLHRASVPDRIGNALVSYLIYLRQMLFPTELAAPYPFVPGGQPLYKVGVAFVVLAVITTIVVAYRKKRPSLLMGWLWYLGMLFPVIGLIQISSDTAHADRFTYLPEIGLAIAGIWAIADWSQGWKYRREVLGGLMPAVMGILIVLGHTQVSYWRDDESLWTRALACTPGISIAHNGLGLAFLAKDKNEEAIAQYRKALEINPIYPKAWDGLGIALIATGKTEEAIVQFHKALKINPDFAEAWNNLGVALFKKGEHEEAIAKYRKALELDPDYVKARYNLGDALVQLGRLDEAITQFRKVLEATPDNAPALNNFGVALELKGQNKEAIAQFKNALAINPNYPDALCNLGAAFVKEGKLDEAITQYRNALAIDPAYVKAGNNLGKALLRKGDFDGALACFTKDAGLKKDPLTTWHNLGNDFLHKNNLVEAIACYRQAIKIAPRSADVWAGLGLAFFQNEQIKEAIDSWQQALETKPDQPNVQNNLAWLLATTPDSSLRNGARAVALAEQAKLLTAGDNPMVLHTLAAAYAETGRYSAATAMARRALELAVAQKNDDLTNKLPKEIKLYELDTPLRDAPQ
jgi:protein O-mannosyl-transferase